MSRVDLFYPGWLGNTGIVLVLLKAGELFQLWGFPFMDR